MGVVVVHPLVEVGLVVHLEETKVLKKQEKALKSQNQTLVEVVVVLPLVEVELMHWKMQHTS